MLDHRRILILNGPKPGVVRQQVAGIALIRAAVSPGQQILIVSPQKLILAEFMTRLRLELDNGCTWALEYLTVRTKDRLGFATGSSIRVTDLTPLALHGHYPDLLILPAAATFSPEHWEILNPLLHKDPCRDEAPWTILTQ